MDNEVDFDELTRLIRSFEEGAKSPEKRDTKYQYSYVSMPEVESNIDEYIIPELQEACKSLWERNVFTFMCSNRNDGGSAYIILESLSPENKEIFEQLKQDHPEYFIFDNYRHADRIQIPDVTKMSEEEISTAFVKLTRHFVSQDVQPRFYLTPEDYLIDCGCYDEIPNPEYKGDPGPMPTTSSLKELDEYFAKCNIPQTIKVFNKGKMTKSFKEYVIENQDENRTDFTTGKVYESPYFLKKHFEFINLQRNEKTL